MLYLKEAIQQVTLVFSKEEFCFHLVCALEKIRRAACCEKEIAQSYSNSARLLYRCLLFHRNSHTGSRRVVNSVGNASHFSVVVVDKIFPLTFATREDVKLTRNRFAVFVARSYFTFFQLLCQAASKIKRCMMCAVR